MSSVQADFEKFEKLMGSNSIKNKLSIPQKIEMYGLWCVAKRGKCTRAQPSRMNLVAYGKYTAWKRYEHLSQDEAKKRFVQRAKQLAAEKSKL